MPRTNWARSFSWSCRRWEPSSRSYQVIVPKDATSALDPFDLESSLRQTAFLFNGTITEVNSEVVEAPEIINEDPYVAGWMAKVKMSDSGDGLMDAAAYEAMVAEEG